MRFDFDSLFFDLILIMFVNACKALYYQLHGHVKNNDFKKVEQFLVEHIDDPWLQNIPFPHKMNLSILLEGVLVESSNKRLMDEQAKLLLSTDQVYCMVMSACEQSK